MKKFSTFLILFLGLSLVSSSSINERPLVGTQGKPMWVPDEIIVKYTPEVMGNEIAKKLIEEHYNLLKEEDSYKQGEFVVYKHLDPLAILDDLNNEPGIIYAEQNAYSYICMYPNDPYYVYQWHMRRIGMETAWDISSGSGVLTAVIDTGVKQSLADLANTNFTAGWDFVNNDNDPTDDEGHGSHVCGTVAQSTNNNIGVSGIAYDCTIMPVKVLNDQGTGTYDEIANGIVFAVDNGADILNLSLGGYAASTTVENAVNYAWNNGAVVVCAAGNDNLSSPFYPAAYANSIAVTATNYLEQRPKYANYGSWVDICAPGGDTNDYNGDGYVDGVLQNTFGAAGENYYFYFGTSMASPHVAGTAALLKAQDPSRTNAEIRAVLESAVIDLGTPGWDPYYGFGRVDARVALTNQPIEIYVYDISMSLKKAGINCTASALITLRDTSGNPVPNAAVYVTWSGVVEGSDSVISIDGTVTFTSAKVKSTGPFIITVDNVTHNSYIYNPSLNNETSDSITY